MFKINKDFLAGTVIGFGAGLATRALSTESGNEWIRNAAKNTMKWSVVSLEALKLQVSQLKENLEDIAAEAKAEATTPQVEVTPTVKNVKSKKSAASAAATVGH